MYFIDNKHQQNYNHLVKKVFRNEESSEYKAASYVLALPEIYSRCINKPLFHEFPFIWKYVYKDVSYDDKDEIEEYRVVEYQVEKNEHGEAMVSEDFSSLSNRYKKLFYLAQNLFNSSKNNFNLMDAFETWDTTMIKVFYEAVNIRLEGKGYINGMNGITVSIEE